MIGAIPLSKSIESPSLFNCIIPDCTECKAVYERTGFSFGDWLRAAEIGWSVISRYGEAEARCPKHGRV